MTIELSDFTPREGAFSIVLLDTTKMLAYKLFKSYHHPALNGSGKEETGEEETNKYRRQVFTTELEAYANAQSSALLKKFTPSFYGHHPLDKVLEYGVDVTYQFLPDCCIKMASVAGKDFKLNLLRGNPSELKILQDQFGFDLNELLEEFHKHNINYITDASFISNENEFRIIDFGTMDPQNFQPIRNR